jgi:hypothetical protein
VSGEYALVVLAVLPGHKAYGTIDSTGKVASYRIANGGLSTGNAVPTYAWPAAAGFTTAPTLPTATVGTILVGEVFSALSGDGLNLAYWGNNAGALASAPFGGTQLTLPLKAYIDALRATLSTTSPIYLGNAASPPAGGSTASTGTFIFGDAFTGTAPVATLLINASAASTIYLKQFSKSGSTYTQIGGDVPLSWRQALTRSQTPVSRSRPEIIWDFSG